MCSDLRVCLLCICIKHVTIKMCALGTACAEKFCNNAGKLTCLKPQAKLRVGVYPVLLLNDNVFYVCCDINNGFVSHKKAKRLPSKKSNKKKQYSPAWVCSVRM